MARSNLERTPEEDMAAELRQSLDLHENLKITVYLLRTVCSSVFICAIARYLIIYSYFITDCL